MAIHDTSLVTQIKPLMMPSKQHRLLQPIKAGYLLSPNIFQDHLRFLKPYRVRMQALQCLFYVLLNNTIKCCLVHGNFMVVWTSFLEIFWVRNPDLQTFTFFHLKSLVHPLFLSLELWSFHFIWLTLHIFHFTRSNVQFISFPQS